MIYFSVKLVADMLCLLATVLPKHSKVKLLVIHLALGMCSLALPHADDEERCDVCNKRITKDAVLSADPFIIQGCSFECLGLDDPELVED